MTKFVYKKGNSVTVLDEQLKDEKLASISDLRTAIETAKNDLKAKWEHDDSPLGFDDILEIDLSDILVLEEGRFIWDNEIADYKITPKLKPEWIEELSNIDTEKLLKEVGKERQMQQWAEIARMTQPPKFPNK